MKCSIPEPWRSLCVAAICVGALFAIGAALFVIRSDRPALAFEAYMEAWSVYLIGYGVLASYIVVDFIGSRRKK